MRARVVTSVLLYTLIGATFTHMYSYLCT